ncbi:MAG TPA: L-threonylcarbamoyladenylate synthase [Puia sp.]
MEFEQDILNCLEVLRRGGIILYPTDTIWGIGCDATNPSAVNRIFELKQRSTAKSMIVLVADQRDVNRFTSHADPHIAAYLEKTKVPTTVIYEGALGLAENLVGEDGTIAIRIVRDDFCRHLVKRLRKPLVSTSANRSGNEPPKNFSEVSDEIILKVDYTVRYRQTDNNMARASAIIRFDKKGKPVILRS